MRQNFQAEQLEKFSLDNCLRCLERTSRRHTENIRFGNGCSRISHLNSEIKFNNKKYIIFTFKIEYVICTDFKILYYNIASPIFHFWTCYQVFHYVFHPSSEMELSYNPSPWAHRHFFNKIQLNFPRRQPVPRIAMIWQPLYWLCSPNEIPCQGWAHVQRPSRNCLIAHTRSVEGPWISGQISRGLPALSLSSSIPNIWRAQRVARKKLSPALFRRSVGVPIKSQSQIRPEQSPTQPKPFQTIPNQPNPTQVTTQASGDVGINH